MRTVSRILAATDFSPSGDAALIRGGQMAAEHGAELRILHATPDWNLFSNRAPMAQQHYTELSRTAERLLEEAKDRIASEFAVHVISELHKGKASQSIARCVESYQPGLLVLGVSAEAIETCSADAEIAARYAADPPWADERNAAKMHMHLVRGAPLPSVLAEISRQGAQVIVIGRHEQFPLSFEHPLMGCIGKQIAYHCPVDVLMVP